MRLGLLRRISIWDLRLKGRSCRSWRSVDGSDCAQFCLQVHLAQARSSLDRSLVDLNPVCHSQLQKNWGSGVAKEAIGCFQKRPKTINNADSRVVTNLDTSASTHSLSTAERTGGSVFYVLWSIATKPLLLENIEPSFRAECVGPKWASKPSFDIFSAFWDKLNAPIKGLVQPHFHHLSLAS
jgi:hypothetical protein